MATKLDLTSGVVWVLNAINLNVATLTTTRNGIATTSTDGLILANTTASTSGVPVQQSPRIRLRSNVWNTTVTAANNTNDWIIESVPVSGLTPSGVLKIGSSLNGAAYTFPMTLTSAGVLTTLSNLVTVAGSSSAPSVQLGGTYGLYSPLANGVSIATNGNEQVRFSAGQSIVASGSTFDWLSGAFGVGTVDTSIKRGAAATVSIQGASSAAGGLLLGPSGGASSSYWFTKKVTAIGDASATTVLTVTIPNANHAASLKLRFLSSNGSTDAFESSRTAEGTVVFARIAGSNTVATAVAISDEAIATSGVNTHTLAYSVTAMTGAADATQTCNIQVTINDDGNVGGNQVVVLAELINAEATGITVA